MNKFRVFFKSKGHAEQGKQGRVLLHSSFGQNVSCILFCLFRPSGSNKALKLGTKGKEVDNFVDKLKSEGENIVASSVGKRSTNAAAVLAPPINMERYVYYPGMQRGI